MFVRVVSLALIVVAEAQNYTFGLLEDRRSEYKFVPYTPKQRTDVARTVANMFDIYVNTESKIKTYGMQYPNIDPIPRIKKLKANAASLTDKDFHYQMVELFWSLRDFHTVYSMPGPHSCLVAYKAPMFTVIDVGEGSPRVQKIVFAKFISFKEVVDATPDASKMTIGDELLKIDGQGIDDYIQDQAFIAGGANEYGALRSALGQLSIRFGKYDKVPEKNWSKYEMKSAATGKKYIVNIPWVTRSDEDCVSEALALSKKVREGKHIASGNQKSMKSAILMKKKWNQGKNPLIPLIQEAFGTTAQGVMEVSPLYVTQTDDPSISWAIYNVTNRNMGIIYLSSFNPLNDDSIRAALLIRSLLLNQLKDTNSLVFDVRNNGGGLIYYADILPQLVGSNIVTLNSKAVVSSINKRIFINNTSYATDEWTEAYKQTQPGDKYTPYVKFTSIKNANSLGQVYLKPVGVFINGKCYSSCEFFSATMQDNHIATIFGEDGGTGGGGANVIKLNQFNSLLPLDFPLSPFSNELSLSRQNPSIGWRAIIRIGVNEGRWIEDSGVSSEKIFRPSIDDLNPNLAVYSQYHRISEVLEKQALSSGKKYMYFQISLQLQTDSSLDSPVQFKVEIQGLSTIKIYNESKKLVSSKDIPKKDVTSKKRKKFDYSFLPGLKEASSEKYNIKVYDLKGSLQMSTFRTIRFLPKATDLLKITMNSNIVINFKSQGKYFANYDSKDVRDKKLGFNPTNKGMTIADGRQYVNSLTSTLTYFINALVPFKAVVKASYETEKDYDFLRIGYVKGGKTTQFLSSTNSQTGSKQDGVSGKGDVMSEFKIPSGKIEFFINFVSDRNVNSVGVTVQSLAFKALK